MIADYLNPENKTTTEGEQIPCPKCEKPVWIQYERKNEIGWRCCDCCISGGTLL